MFKTFTAVIHSAKGRYNMGVSAISTDHAHYVAKQLLLDGEKIFTINPPVYQKA